MGISKPLIQKWGEEKNKNLLVATNRPVVPALRFCFILTFLTRGVEKILLLRCSLHVRSINSTPYQVECSTARYRNLSTVVAVERKCVDVEVDGDTRTFVVMYCGIPTYDECHKIPYPVLTHQSVCIPACTVQQIEVAKLMPMRTASEP